MEIIVLLKQVPATESFVAIADDAKSIRTEDLKWVINPYDEFAVEEALKIREQHGGTVTILTVGPDAAVESVRTALAMGADKGILINDPAATACDSLGVARILAAAIKQNPFDLIIAGQRAVDDDAFIVGTAVAQTLDIPNIALVVKAQVTDGTLTCHRTIEGGTVVLETPLPALFTTQRGLNEPRYASLPGIMKAKKKPLEKKTLADIGMAEAPAPMTPLVELKLPPERKGGRMIDLGSAQANADELVKVLQQEAKVI